MEALVERTKRIVAGFGMAWLKEQISELGRWAGRGIAFYAVGLVLVCTAIVFLLVGGVQALRELNVPPWATYLGIGAVAGLLGVILMTRRPAR